MERKISDKCIEPRVATGGHDKMATKRMQRLAKQSAALWSPTWYSAAAWEGMGGRCEGGRRRELTPRFVTGACEPEAAALFSFFLRVFLLFSHFKTTALQSTLRKS